MYRATHDNIVSISNYTYVRTYLEIVLLKKDNAPLSLEIIEMYVRTYSNFFEMR